MSLHKLKSHEVFETNQTGFKKAAVRLANHTRYLLVHTAYLAPKHFALVKANAKEGVREVLGGVEIFSEDIEKMSNAERRQMLESLLLEEGIVEPEELGRQTKEGEFSFKNLEFSNLDPARIKEVFTFSEEDLNELRKGFEADGLPEKNIAMLLAFASGDSSKRKEMADFIKSSSEEELEEMLKEDQED